SALVELIARLRERFIVFGPTARQVEAACWELLASANAAYFPLEGNVMLTHNATLQPTRSPGELFRKFTPQPGEADLSEAQRIFALVQQLEAESRNKLPSVLTVFRLYCLEQLKVDQIADRCRCAKGTISHRLQAIRRMTGTDPLAFRRMSAHFDRMMEGATDSRAVRTYVRTDE